MSISRRNFVIATSVAGLRLHGSLGLQQWWGRWRYGRWRLDEHRQVLRRHHRHRGRLHRARARGRRGPQGRDDPPDRAGRLLAPRPAAHLLLVELHGRQPLHPLPDRLQDRLRRRHEARRRPRHRHRHHVRRRQDLDLHPEGRAEVGGRQRTHRGGRTPRHRARLRELHHRGGHLPPVRADRHERLPLGLQGPVRRQAPQLGRHGHREEDHHLPSEDGPPGPQLDAGDALLRRRAREARHQGEVRQGPGLLRPVPDQAALGRQVPDTGAQHALGPGDGPDPQRLPGLLRLRVRPGGAAGHGPADRRLRGRRVRGHGVQRGAAWSASRRCSARRT